MQRLPALLVAPFLSIALFAPIATPALGQSTVTAFGLDSEPENELMRGETAVRTPTNAQIQASGDPFSVTMTATSGPSIFRAVVRAPNGRVLQAGTYWASKNPDANNAGLDVSPWTARAATPRAPA